MINDHVIIDHLIIDHLIIVHLIIDHVLIMGGQIALHHMAAAEKPAVRRWEQVYQQRLTLPTSFQCHLSDQT